MILMDVRPVNVFEAGVLVCVKEGKLRGERNLYIRSKRRPCFQSLCPWSGNG